MAQQSIAVPAFSASAVEEVCKVLAEAVTGPQLPNLIAPLLVTEEPGELPGYDGRQGVLVPVKIALVVCSRELAVVVREF
ncbi:MAG: hypothetical protein JWM19_7246 [Actinomycetia bacterium]|nr:hypothetical protein [Actinomycetes bacterium]